MILQIMTWLKKFIRNETTLCIEENEFFDKNGLILVFKPF